MLPDRRAVVFDLDDTLYPYRRFVMSGFAAVSAHLARTARVDRRQSFRVLARASRGAMRGREIQACLERFGLRDGLVDPLVGIIRHHQPTMRLPRVSTRALERLRFEGWRLGVLTNGPRSVQARKIAALGLACRVDTVVFASEHGPSGVGKPDPEPFAEVLRRLGVLSGHAVFVGNDEACDVAGAAGAGLAAVLCTAWTAVPESTAADAVLRRLGDTPRIVRTVLEEALTRHAA